MLALLGSSAFVMLKMFNRTKENSTSVDTSGFDLSTAAANENPREGPTAAGSPESRAPDQAQGSSGLEMNPDPGAGMSYGGGTAAPPNLSGDSEGPGKIDSGKIMNKISGSNPDLQKAGQSGKPSAVR